MALVFVAGYLALTRLPRSRRHDGGADLGPASVASRWRERLLARPTYTFRVHRRARRDRDHAGRRRPDGGRPLPTPTPTRSSPRRSTALPHADERPRTGLPARRPERPPGVAGRACGVRRSRSPSSTRCAPRTARSSPRSSAEPTISSAPTPARVELVAIDINPRYITPDYLLAFDQQEGLDHLSNWLYLTGIVATAHHAHGMPLVSRVPTHREEP